MEKMAFCNEMETRLRDLDTYLRNQTFAQPSTREKSLQQEHLRGIVEKLSAHAEEVRAQLNELRASNDSSWETARAHIERSWAEIDRLLAEVKR